MNSKIISKLFRWQPSRKMFIPILAGLIVIGLSALMIPTRGIPWVSILIRDIGMIFLMGFFFPLFYMKHSGPSFKEFGLTLKRWYLTLPFNFVLGVLLFFLLFSRHPLASFHWDNKTLLSVSYIMLAGVFEVIFFYAFQRNLFEKVFGIIPGIILSALFYSFHHLGFQPEFEKLFYVGLMYGTIFRLGNSAFMIYPFFWGVGACYDVLVQSQKVLPIQFPGVRTLYLWILMVATVIWITKPKR